ncbi:hypothetical protein ACOME3_008155 [Neoechinorhynchus agilis]
MLFHPSHTSVLKTVIKSRRNRVYVPLRFHPLHKVVKRYEMRRLYLIGSINAFVHLFISTILTSLVIAQMFATNGQGVRYGVYRCENCNITYPGVRNTFSAFLFFNFLIFGISMFHAVFSTLEKYSKFKSNFIDVVYDYWRLIRLMAILLISIAFLLSMAFMIGVYIAASDMTGLKEIDSIAATLPLILLLIYGSYALLIFLLLKTKRIINVTEKRYFQPYNQPAISSVKIETNHAQNGHFVSGSIHAKPESVYDFASYSPSSVYSNGASVSIIANGQTKPPDSIYSDMSRISQTAAQQSL